jgi:aryl-alcohol dehydrogenase-like predicted oxidoreductase
MNIRPLGTQGLEVPAIGLGCMVMPGFYNAGGEQQSIATLHRAAEIGANFLDTSDLYGGGANEELVGRALKGRREKYILATKFGNVRDADGKPDVDGRPEYVVAACEGSLKRLGVDHVDLYYLHRVDPKVPIEETVGAMARLVEQGKVRYLGLSEAAPETVARAHKVHPITALQTEYSLWTRDVEADLLPLCAELGIGYVAYSPLGRGIFSGEITGAESLGEGDRRRNHPRFQGENLAKNVRLLEPFLELAGARGCSPAQLALAWVLARGDGVVAIPGTRRVDHLELNVAAAHINLDAADIARLDGAFPAGSAAGTRYPAGGMKWLRL